MRKLAIAFVLAGCGNTNTPMGMPDMSTQYVPDLHMEDLMPPPPMETTAIVTSSSFMMGGTGTLNTIALADHKVTMGIDNTLDQDNDVFYGNGMAFVLDHTHSTLRVYDPSKNFVSPVEIKLGANGNPHAVAAVPTTTRAYVTMYGLAGAQAVAVIDWSKPQMGVVKSIAIPTATKDPDGIPEANDAWLCGQFVYVTLQDLDETKNFVPTGPSRMAVIDTTKDALDGMNGGILQLAGANPNGVAASGGGCDQVLVAEAGNQFADPDGTGGIEAVDLSLRQTGGLLLKDTDLMGHPSTMATNVDKKLVFTVLTVQMGSGSQLVAVDYAGKKLGASLLPTAGFIRFASVSADGQLWAAVDFPAMNGMPAAGLYVGKADGTALPSQAIQLSQAPYSIAFY